MKTTKRCTHLGCRRPPTKVIYPAYGRPWFGCPTHTPAMAAALSLGQPPERAARSVPLDNTKKAS